MGSSSSFFEVATKMGRLSYEVARIPRSGVERAALTTKRLIQVEMHGVTRLSGVGRKGAKVGVRYDVKGVENATALVRATGPFHLLERDTKAHQIAPKRRNKSGVLSNQARGGNFVAGGTVSHPGTKGKHPFRKGVETAIPLVENQFRAAQTTALRKVF